MHRSRIQLPTRQRGAVLYVALIFLILLSLLGIVGMQVAALQERMASNYRATNQAFQRAEGLARRVEVQINADGRFIPRPGERDEERFCDDPDPVRGSAWAGLRASDDDPDTAVVATQIDACAGGGRASIGNGPRNERGDATYQISVFTTDLPADATSDAAVETVFKP